jgi:AcrR family transcriptional regulator
VLYYHVGDKAELYSAVLSRAFAQIRATLDEALAAESDPEERFAALVRTIVGMASELPHHPRMMLREVAAGGGNLPDDVVRQMAGILDLRPC